MNGKSNHANSGRPRRFQLCLRPYICQKQAFTLIELMAVVVIILIVSIIGLGVQGYVQKKMAVASTKAQIAALATALENYKNDWGYYPATCPCRLSAMFFCESTNNWILYRTLSGFGGRKQYMSFPAGQLRISDASCASNLLTGGAAPLTGGLTNFFDAWGRPFVYYNSPAQTFGVGNSSDGYALGGQVNITSYDLFSFGPDGYTYVPAIVSLWYNSAKWSARSSAADDIANWNQ